MQPLAREIIGVVTAVQERFNYDTIGVAEPDVEVLRDLQAQAVEDTLRKSLFLDELAASVAEVARHLETEPPELRAALRAAIARTMRELAAFR